MALTLPPEHLPQSGPQSMETQAGEGQLESGALDEGWLTPMCVHMHERSFSHTYHTHSFRMCMCARARAHKAFRKGSEGRGSEKNREGQGKLSLWLVTQSVWDNLSALS